MADTHPWLRLCVDLDRAGNPIGASIEQRDDREPLSLLVLPLPEPFATPVEVFLEVLGEAHDRYGVQLSLFP